MKKISSRDKIEKEFVDLFSEKFFKQLDKYGELISCFDDKNFTERQSYGLVVSSLMDMGNKLDFVLTEVGVVRSGGVSKNGRVDYLIGYGKWLFLVELKLIFSGLNNINRKATNCANSWDEKGSGVVNQLLSISKEQNKILAVIIREHKYQAEIVKLPMLIVMYAPYSEVAGDSTPDVIKKNKKNTKERHEVIANQLKCTHKDKLLILKKPIVRKHTRRNGTPWYRTTYGVGIMAGALGLMNRRK